DLGGSGGGDTLSDERRMDWLPSIARKWHERARQQMARVAATASLRQNVAPPPALHQELLGVARSLLDRHEYRAAVVIAQTACEVLTAQVIGHLLTIRQAGYLEDWIQRRRWTFSLTNKVVCDLYETLSGDSIARSPLWERYKEHVERRNRVVHRGVSPAPAEGEDSYAVAVELIQRLEPMLKK